MPGGVQAVGSEVQAGMEWRSTEVQPRRGARAAQQGSEKGRAARNLGGRVEPGGQLDMQQLLAAAAAMQSQLMNAQQELADAEVEGTAGGGW